MSTPTPEASGEPLSDEQIADMVEWAEACLRGDNWKLRYTAEILLGFRELQQRRAASLPAAQGADVATIETLVIKWRDAAVGADYDRNHQRAEMLDTCADELQAALDARLSPPQAAEKPMCQSCDGKDDALSIERSLLNILRGDLKRLREQRDGLRHALSTVLQHAPGYDWNADPLSLTLLTGAALNTTPKDASGAFLVGDHSACCGVPPPQGAPEASVDLAQIARETAEKIADARPAFYFHQTGEMKYATPDMANIILAALQRARETGAK